MRLQDLVYDLVSRAEDGEYDGKTLLICWVKTLLTAYADSAVYPRLHEASVGYGIWCV